MVYLSSSGGLVALQTTTDRHILLEQNKVLSVPQDNSFTGPMPARDILQRVMKVFIEQDPIN